MLDIPLELIVCFIESIYQRSLLIFLLLTQVVSSQRRLARDMRSHIGVVCFHSVLFIPPPLRRPAHKLPQFCRLVLVADSDKLSFIGRLDVQISNLKSVVRYHLDES